MSETVNETGVGRRRRHRPRWAAVVALLAGLVLLGAACGSDGDDAESGTADMAEPAVAGEESGGTDESGDDGGEIAAESPDTVAQSDREFAADEEAASDGDGEASSASSNEDTAADGSPLGSGGATVTPTAADLGRKLIFTAFLTVGVDDVSAAGAQATEIIQNMGGFLFGQNTQGGVEPVSELTFKILPADFNRALEALGEVGELRNQSVTTDDVTERVVDLESRIEVAQLGVERLRAALENAGTLEDYAEIERLLLDRESELEVMRGQLRTLEDRIDLATITLVLTQERVENSIDVTITSYDGHDGGRGCPGDRGGAFEQGSDVTLCFDIVNLGDQTLTDIVLTDTALDIDTDNSADRLITVFGSIDELAPGQSVLLAHETNPERNLRLRTRVTAVPTDGVSPEAAGPVVNTQVDSLVETFASEDDPGFGDGFGAAVDVLKWLWVAVTLLIGFLIPLLVLIPFLWLAWAGYRAWRRRRPERPHRPTTGPGTPGGGYQPPPPAPAPTSAPGSASASASAEIGTTTATESKPADPPGSG